MEEYTNFNLLRLSLHLSDALIDFPDSKKTACFNTNFLQDDTEGENKGHHDHGSEVAKAVVVDVQQNLNSQNHLTHACYVKCKHEVVLARETELI